MNLIMASALLFAMLAFQPTLIYSSKGLASASATNNRHIGNGRKHDALASSAKLVMSMESGRDVLVRAARGANDDGSILTGITSGGGGGGIGSMGSGKRSNNNKNKKSNKNYSPESATNLGHKPLDKKFSSVTNQHHQNDNNNNNNNNKGKQRKILKSQPHQNHGKRNGMKQKNENAEKSNNGEKTQSTCRYAKSTWSECDATTNMRTRTLTLKKGESNCLSTRTMQKKCKKACRYEKGSWSECSNGQMTRQDKLKSTGSSADSSCDAVRSINKKCNPGGNNAAGKHGGKGNKERKNKDKASRRAQQQA